MNTTLHEKCPNTGKYGPEKTPYLDTFHAVISKVANITFTKMFVYKVQKRCGGF